MLVRLPCWCCTTLGGGRWLQPCVEATPALGMGILKNFQLLGISDSISDVSNTCCKQQPFCSSTAALVG
eukprot:scaffold172578_cov19-Tisochrysis_lutea.AAC.3